MENNKSDLQKMLEDIREHKTDEWLYGITCPYCESKWLIPNLSKYICDNCKQEMRIKYNE